MPSLFYLQRIQRFAMNPGLLAATNLGTTSAGASVCRDDEESKYLVRFDPPPRRAKDRALFSPVGDLLQRGRGQTVCREPNGVRYGNQCGNAQSGDAEANRQAFRNRKMAFGKSLT